MTIDHLTTAACQDGGEPDLYRLTTTKGSLISQFRSFILNALNLNLLSSCVSRQIRKLLAALRRKPRHWDDQLKLYFL